MRLKNSTLLAYGARHRFLEVLEVGGIGWTSGAQPMDNPFGGPQSTGDFRNIGLHCLAVAAVCEVIAILLRWEADAIAEMRTFGLYHDLGKRHEIMLKDALRGTEQGASGAYNDAGRARVRRHLKAQGVNPTLLIADAWTGHPALARLNGTGDAPVPMPAQILFLADDIIYTTAGECGGTTDVVPVRQRMRDFIDRYPWMLVQGLARFADGSVVEVSDVTDIRALATIRGGELPVNASSFMLLQPLTDERMSVEIAQLANIALADPNDHRAAHLLLVDRISAMLRAEPFAVAAD